MFKWFKKKKDKKHIKNKGDKVVYLDVGNDTFKAVSGNKKLKFKSVIKEVSGNTIIKQKNSINIGGKYYVVGDDTTSLNTKDIKAERDNIREMIIYTVDRLLKNEGGKVVIELLLPQNQLDTITTFRKMFNEVVVVGGNVEYDIVINSATPEGQLILCNKFTTREDKVVVDIGGGTFDIFVTDSDGNITNSITIPLGIRNLASRYLRVVNCKSGTTMSKLLSQNYPFTTSQMKLINDINKEFISSVMIDIENTILAFLNPYCTSIVFCGGGSIVLRKALEEYFKGSNYKLHFMNGDDSVFANVMGLKYHLESGSSNVEVVESEVVVEQEEVVVVEPVIEEFVPCKEVISDKEKFVEDKLNEGMKHKDIAELMGLSVSGVRSYVKKINKRKAKQYE